MARPVSIRDEALLDAARRVFLAHGYQASTARVARVAGVSEGSLFKRYKDKAGLFLAAMDAELGMADWPATLLRGAGQGDLRRTLESVGDRILTRLKIVVPRVLMVHSSGALVARHPRGRHAAQAGARRTLRTLTAFFRAEQRAGRLVMRNPALYAQIFTGALTQYVVQDMLFGIRTAPPAAYIRTVVNLLLCATAAPSARPTRTKGTRP